MELSPRQEDDAFFQDLDALPFEENISPLPGDSGKLLIDAAPHLEHGSLADLSPPKFNVEGWPRFKSATGTHLYRVAEDRPAEDFARLRAPYI